MPPLNPDQMEAKLARTREVIRESGREIERAGRELQESVDELAARREPTATVELNEAELSWLVGQLDNEYVLMVGSTGDLARGKFRQALAIERGAGGRFDKGPEAA